MCKSTRQVTHIIQCICKAYRVILKKIIVYIAPFTFSAHLAQCYYSQTHQACINLQPWTSYCPSFVIGPRFLSVYLITHTQACVRLQPWTFYCPSFVYSKFCATAPIGFVNVFQLWTSLLTWCISMHKTTNLWKFELSCSSKLRDNKKKLVKWSCVLSDAWFRDLKI